jgi:hypothetical protein
MLDRTRKTVAAGAAFAALALGGSAVATATSSTSSSSAPSAAATRQPVANFPAHGSASHEDAEKPVTGAVATKAEAAAIKALGGGTATEVTTDYTGDGYEVTVKQADGSSTEVHLDQSFNVAAGPGGGAPRGAGTGA